VGSIEIFRKSLSEIQCWTEKKQIVLPADEYAEVMSELNSHMSPEDRNHKFVTKPIGNYYCTVINREFDDYIIVGKHLIVDSVEEEWEDKE
jgi:hypothetical protein